MDLSLSLVCPCNNKMYKCARSLKIHMNSNIHMMYEYPLIIKDLEVRNKQYENELLREKRIVKMLLDKLG
jgi:hypothetical protein